MNIIDMQDGTIVRNKRSGAEYVLGDWESDSARVLYGKTYVGAVDYINVNTQGNYEVAE